MVAGLVGLALLSTRAPVWAAAVLMVPVGVGGSFTVRRGAAPQSSFLVGLHLDVTLGEHPVRVLAVPSCGRST